MIHNRIRVTDQNFALADIVAELFVENPMKYTCVAHIDKNPYNCKAENLKWIIDKLYHTQTKTLDFR